MQAGLIFSFLAWAGRCVAARWRPRAASTSHFGCFARLPAPLRWLSALARLGEAGPAPRAPRVVLAGALRPAARFACAPGLASCERWPGGVRWPLGGPARRSSCRSLGWLSGLRRAAAASAPARARPRGAPPAGAVARRWAHFCDYACAPSSQHRTPVRAFLGARLRSRCVCSLVSLSASRSAVFRGRYSSWRRRRVLVPCAAAAAALHRRRGVRSARAGRCAPPLFGFCRGDWQTRRFARRRGRSPPCQRVRY